VNSGFTEINTVLENRGDERIFRAVPTEKRCVDKSAFSPSVLYIDVSLSRCERGFAGSERNMVKGIAWNGEMAELEAVFMTGSNKVERKDAGRDTSTTVPQGDRHMPLDEISRSRLEGAFVSPCGTEGARWEGFPEWPEEFPYDAFGDDWAIETEREDKK
jgi:hypothetical protein